MIPHYEDRLLSVSNWYTLLSRHRRYLSVETNLADISLEGQKYISQAGHLWNTFLKWHSKYLVSVTQSSDLTLELNYLFQIGIPCYQDIEDTSL